MSQHVTEEQAQGFQMALRAIEDVQVRDHLAARLQDAYGPWWLALEEKDRTETLIVDGQ